MDDELLREWFQTIHGRHDSLRKLLEVLMADAAALKTAIDNLTAAVAKVAAEVAALKAQQPLIDQASLDADTAAVQAAADALNAV